MQVLHVLVFYAFMNNVIALGETIYIQRLLLDKAVLVVVFLVEGHSMNHEFIPFPFKYLQCL